jgi:hypothetical protein
MNDNSDDFIFETLLQTLLKTPDSRRVFFACLRAQERWSRLSEQIFRLDKWSLCRG